MTRIGPSGGGQGAWGRSEAEMPETMKSRETMSERNARASCEVSVHEPRDRRPSRFSFIFNASAAWRVNKDVKKAWPRVCILTASLLFFSVLAGDERAIDLSEAITRVEERYNSAETMQLLFEQEYRSRGRPPVNEAGVLYLRQPKQMRWEYAKPKDKLFLSDGKFVYFYSPSGNRVEKMKLKESGDMRTPLAFLMGRLDLRRDFREFRSRPVGGNLEILALPTSDKAPYEEVTFVVTPEYRIRTLVVSGRDGSAMEFQFSEERMNPPLGAGVFEFKMPPGAEFVEITGDEGGQ